MIPKNTVDIIIETAHVEEVVGEFITLKKRGANLLGLCPFHGEKTPSFTVSSVKGIYKCFACGASGDLFRFLMEYKKMAFSEVVQDLAEECGLEIIKKEISVELNEEQNWIFKLNGLATNFFIDHLQFFK